jgi:hypothetical protein
MDIVCNVIGRRFVLRNVNFSIGLDFSRAAERLVKGISSHGGIVQVVLYACYTAVLLLNLLSSEDPDFGSLSR